MSARGRIMTRMKRLGPVGGGLREYRLRPASRTRRCLGRKVERAPVSMRMPPSSRQRMPGP